MESWRTVWRDGFVPVLSNNGLKALAAALKDDDQRLIQGATTTPPPLMCVQDWPVEAACPIGFCGWQGHDLDTVGQVEGFFARACYECDQRLGEPAACRWWLNWWDDTPRNEAIHSLLEEVERAIGQHPSKSPRKFANSSGPRPRRQRLSPFPNPNRGLAAGEIKWKSFTPEDY